MPSPIRFCHPLPIRNISPLFEEVQDTVVYELSLARLDKFLQQ